MFLVKDWLLEFVLLNKTMSDAEIARRLSLSTVEVESVRKGCGQDLSNIIIGKILSVKPHPNADRLRIVRVNCSAGEPKTIVCGGSNVAVGMMVAVALPGARVRWHGEGELIVLEKTTIRGQESDGMICASAEIGLADVFPAKDEREILDLSSVRASAGTPLAEVIFQNTVFEIDNKSLSHRPDLWGHRGMAREISAVCGVPFHDRKLPALPNGIGHALSVTVADPDLCSRYIGLVVDGVSHKDSPSWMQERLRVCGVRPVSALVDVTNYVMLEYGQPMHVFDFEKIAEKKGAHIIVRRAQEHETIRALDGNDYTPSSDSLIIANTHKPIAIAGVMGGEESGVSETTTTIMLEAAHFAPHSIRRTATRLGLASESSRRFEKDLDSELPVLAMARCLQLLAKIFPKSRVSSPVRDVQKKQPTRKTIIFEHAFVEQRLGFSIPLGRAATLLKRLGFEVRTNKKGLIIGVPSFRRKDITLPEDILEELVRLVGYEIIPSSLPAVSLTASRPDTMRQTIRVFKNRLAHSFGFREVYTYAFVQPHTIRACGFSLDDHLRLANPLSEERPFLCRSLIPNLLEVLEKNKQKEKRHAFFEINRVFLKEAFYPRIPSDQNSPVPHQPIHCGFVYSAREDAHAFAFCADAMAVILSSLGWSAELREYSPFSVFGKKRSAVIAVNDIPVGSLGEVAGQTRAHFGIDTEVVAGEIDLSALVVQPQTPLRYCPTGNFPSVMRDVTVTVNEAVAYHDIEKTLNTAHPLIEYVEPFAVYRDEKVGTGKKNVSFHISYRSEGRTLTNEEADKAHAITIDTLTRKLKTGLQ